MKDYAQYSSRIPTPNFRRRSSSGNGARVQATTTKNVTSHPLSTSATATTTSSSSSSSPNNNGAFPTQHIATPSPSATDKRERESTSTASSGSAERTGAPTTPANGGRTTPNSGTRSTTTPSPHKQRAPSSLQQRAHPYYNASNRRSPRTPKSPNRSKTTTPTATEQQQQHSPQSQSMSASDALSLRQNGSEATISKLREALDEATTKDTTAKAALAKSDAVILELRSSVRQLKRQLDQVHKDQTLATQEAQSQKSSTIQQLQERVQQLQRDLHQSKHSNSANETVGELQVQLDRAHAQILTADMVRKELEDTLEAEQYTWELRVQDQERQMAELQQDCDTLQNDLQTCRGQWKEAEEGWNTQLEALQEQLQQKQLEHRSGTGPQEEFMQKIQQLEQERAELQGCLDEALQELEAVDAELQTDGNGGDASTAAADKAKMVESMQRLLQWIWQEGPVRSPQRHALSREPETLLSQIQNALERWIQWTHEMQQQQQQQQQQQDLSKGDRALPKSSASTNSGSDVTDLQQQIQVYHDELKSREESSSELRESLKEAVALLKPLQDAVAKAEEDKQSLQGQLQELDRKRQAEHRAAQQEVKEQEYEIRSLQEQVTSLQEQVEEHKQLATARQALLSAAAVSPAATTPRSMSNSVAPDESLTKIQRAREELRRKRETEGNLQQLLKDAQSRFHSLQVQNDDVAARNRELQGQLKSAEDRFTGNDEGATLEEQLRDCQQRLSRKETQIRSLQEALEQGGDNRQLQELNQELEQTKAELAKKENNERILNKSLREALGLLKPLQMHLEEAEQEKMEISKELRNLRKRFRQLQMGELDDQSKSTFGGGQDVSVELVKIKEELEETVRQLEMENSQLHDALEDLSDNGMDGAGDAKLRQHLVELNSRYEVTQNKLEDAHVENHALVKALRQKELEEGQQMSEVTKLREQLAKTESELQNAKSIARSALVKVEELTMANVEQLSLSRDGSLDNLNLSKMVSS